MSNRETDIYRASDLYCWNAGTGDPLLLLHGDPATHTLWRPLVAELEREHALFAPDLPGFGRSPFPSSAGFGLEKMARLVLEMASLRGIERFDLIGHSLGGAIAATIAALRPDRIRSLVLITPLGLNVPPFGRIAYIPPLREAARALWKLAPARLRRSIVRRFYRISSGRGFTDARADEVAGELEKGSAIDAMIGFLTAVDYDAYRNAIVELSRHRQIRTLMIGCRLDRVVPYEEFTRIRDLLAPRSCRIFDEGGHLPMWQYPTEMAAEIGGFLRERSGKA